MALRVVGAGLPRTGTRSLKTALERLLGGPCYHMTEVFPRPHHTAAWHRVAHGGDPDWDTLLDGFVAAVDYPVSAFWPELAARYPDAIVLLSHRDPASWWRSVDATIFEGFRRPPDADADPTFREMVTRLLSSRLSPSFLDPDAAMAAAVRHDQHVRATVPRDRLVEWSPGDGWGPLCAALGVPVPEEPYPHENSTAEFRARAQLPAL